MPKNKSQHEIELPFAQSHAFIIGINNYENISSLTTAVNDAKGIAKRLRNDHGYKVHPPLLNAKKAEIVEWMEHDVPKAVGPEDRVVFYFAGHGIALDSEEGPNGYIVPADADPSSVDSLIAMHDYHKMIDKLQCKHGLLILDCCFAGAFKWSTGFRDVLFDMPSVIYEERFWRYVKDPAWQVITSSAYDQKAADVISERTLGKRENGAKGGHSPFAVALFEALDGKGDVIPQGKESDGVITATELYMYLRDRVEGNSTDVNKRQTPSFFTLPKHDKGEFIFFHPRHRLNLPPAPDRNPFMGLSSYDENDASLFFGRDRVIEALEDMLPGHHLIVVSGASGTGKSSVIKAGLLPKMRKNGWQVLPVVRPGKEPKKNLEEQLPEAEKLFAANPKSVLVIDQYEELITQCLDPEEGKAFERHIAEWIKAHPDLRVILSVRSDFEPQFEDSLLRPWWDKGRYIVPAFTLEEYREVIVKPASQEVLFYEPDELVERLVEEVSQAPGALPLLSFTLSELYQAYLKSGRTDRALIESDYDSLGGVIGALRTRADASYNDLDREKQGSMRKLMLRMVSMEGGDLAGKRVYADELRFSSKAETARIKEVAGKLVEARLLLSGKDNNEKTYVEPAHDALVRSWGRLWEWIKATGEEKLTLHNKLGIAVNDYHDLIKDSPKKARNLLWNNNPRLSLLKAELQDKDHALNAREEEFVLASAKRRKTARRNLILITLAVMAGLIGLTIYSFIQQQIAKKEALNAKIESTLANSRYFEDRNHLQAFRYAEAGFNLTMENDLDPGDFVNQLIKTTYDRTRFETIDTVNMKVDEVQVSGTASKNNFDFDIGGKLIRETDPEGGLVHGYRINALDHLDLTDRKKIVHVSNNGKYIVAEIDIGDHTGPGTFYQLFFHKGDSISTSLNSIVAYFSDNPYVFDAAGRVIEMGSTFRILQTLENQFIYESEFSGFGKNSTAMAFSPSGTWFAVGSKEGRIRLFDATDSKKMTKRRPRLLYEFPAHYNERISDIAFCNDETLLKTVTMNGVKYWSLASVTFADPLEPGQIPPPDYKGPVDPVTGIMLSSYQSDGKKPTIKDSNDNIKDQIFQSKNEPWRSYKLTYTGLYSDKEELLVRIDQRSPGPNEMDVGSPAFLAGGRYMKIAGDFYPIDPQLIIGRINKYKVLGELPPLRE